MYTLARGIDRNRRRQGHPVGNLVPPGADIPSDGGDSTFGKGQPAVDMRFNIKGTKGHSRRFNSDNAADEELHRIGRPGVAPGIPAPQSSQVVVSPWLTIFPTG